MKLIRSNLQIAIDGPVGAGKSIGASQLAKRLNILYVYTGATYRAVAWIGLKHDLDLQEEKPLVNLVKKTKIELKKASKKSRVCDVLIDGQDVTEELFSSRVHWGSSQVAVFPEVRKYLVKLQQEIAENQPVVMEGRDITTVVLPRADLKIYMTASLEVRAKRRMKDLLARGEKTSFKEVLTDIQKRDYNDTHRKADPLKIAPDAWILDTSKLTVKEEVDLVITKLKTLGLII